LQPSAVGALNKDRLLCNHYLSSSQPRHTILVPSH
jgi:hypothetical protein